VACGETHLCIFRPVLPFCGVSRPLLFRRYRPAPLNNPVCFFFFPPRVNLCTIFTGFFRDSSPFPLCFFFFFFFFLPDFLFVYLPALRTNFFLTPVSNVSFPQNPQSKLICPESPNSFTLPPDSLPNFLVFALLFSPGCCFPPHVTRLLRYPIRRKDQHSPNSHFSTPPKRLSYPPPLRLTGCAQKLVPSPVSPPRRHNRVPFSPTSRDLQGVSIS